MGSIVLSGRNRITVPGGQRQIFTLTCTGDGTIDAYNFDPAPYGIAGWFLYSVTTKPGTDAPTDGYDLTLMVNGEDIAGGLLVDRSSTITQTVLLAPTSLGYPMVDDVITITIANETSNPSTIEITLRFTSN